MTCSIGMAPMSSACPTGRICVPKPNKYANNFAIITWRTAKRILPRTDGERWDYPSIPLSIIYYLIFFPLRLTDGAFVSIARCSMAANLSAGLLRWASPRIAWRPCTMHVILLTVAYCDILIMFIISRINNCFIISAVASRRQNVENATTPNFSSFICLL